MQAFEQETSIHCETMQEIKLTNVARKDTSIKARRLARLIREEYEAEQSCSSSSDIESLDRNLYCENATQC